MLRSACQEMVEAAGDDEKELAAQMAAEFLNEDLAEQQFGAAKAGPGMWASILRMLDPIKVNTIKLPVSGNLKCQAWVQILPY